MVNFYHLVPIPDAQKVRGSTILTPLWCLLRHAIRSEWTFVIITSAWWGGGGKAYSAAGSAVYVTKCPGLLPLPPPHLQLVEEHRKWVAKNALDIRGRIYFSSQGVNAQYGGSTRHAKAYVEWLASQPLFQVSAAFVSGDISPVLIAYILYKLCGGPPISRKFPGSNRSNTVLSNRSNTVLSPS